MPKLPRIDREAVFTPTAPNTAEAEFQFSLADRLSRFAQRRAADDRARAVKKAKEEGLNAASGRIQAPQRREGDDPITEAFNEGQLLAHRSAVRLDARDTIARLASENERDPEGFSLKLTRYRSGLMAELDPALQADIDTFINELAGRANRRIVDNVRRESTRSALETVRQDIDATREDALIAARNGDVEAATAAQLEIQRLLDRGLELGVLDANAIRETRESIGRDVDRESLIGQFQRLLDNEGTEAASQRLDAFRKSPVDMLPEDHDRLVARMEGMLRGRMAEERASRSANDAALRARIKDAEAQAARGLPVTDESLRDDVRGTRFERDVVELIQQAEIARTFALGSPIEREAQLNELRRRETLTGPQARLLTRLERVDAELQRELNRDPLALAAQQFPGKVKLEPLDPRNFGASLAARMEGVRFAEAHYGVTVPPVTEQEAELIGRAFQESDLEGRMGLISGIVENTGESARAVLGMLDAKNQRDLALAGEMMVQGVPGVARMVLMGSEWAKENPKILPRDTDMLPEINSALGTAFPAAKHRAEVTRGIKLTYAAMAAEQGAFDGELDRDILDAAIEAVTGGIIEYNGVQFEPPRRGVTEDDFSAWLDERLSEADLQAAGGVKGINLSDAVELIQDARPLAIRDPETGEVVYQFMLATGFLLREDGEPLQLRYTDESLGPRLRKPEGLPDIGGA